MSRLCNVWFAGTACAVVVMMSVINYRGINAMATENITAFLRMYAASIYEYRDKTGRWPTRIEDLGETSLPRQTPYWKALVDDEVDVIVWPTNMKPDPKENASVLLAYHNKGLHAELGHSWVVWGDLRTEFITTEELHAILNGGRK
jgi:hypothetical protein